MGGLQYHRKELEKLLVQKSINWPIAELYQTGSILLQKSIKHPASHNKGKN